MQRAGTLPAALPSSGTMKVPAAKQDTLARRLAELCKSGALERWRDGEHALRDYVEAEARDLAPEPLKAFLRNIYARVHHLITSADPHERLAGALAIDELIDVKVQGEDTDMLSRFAAYLRELFQPGTDPATMAVAAAVLGHLVAFFGPLAADVVDLEVRRALSWLEGERVEGRRHAAVLVLRQMATAAPAVFNVHVKVFIQRIWAALRDPSLPVREAAVAALRACLVLVEKRETRYRMLWFHSLFYEAVKPLKPGKAVGESTKRRLAPGGGGSRAGESLEVVHGSLLALGELLRHTGEFMLSRYQEVVDIVLRYRDSKAVLVRRAILMLIPLLAAYTPERFAAQHLPDFMQHLLTVLRNPAERGAGFVALGDTAAALARAGCAEGLEPALPAVAAALRDALSARTKPRLPCPEALQCAGTLATALRSAWAPHARALLEDLLATGLSDTLVRALQAVVGALPELLGAVQSQLLDLLSLALQRRAQQQAPPGELQGPALTRLALHTLAKFDFGSRPLLPFVRSYVMPYMDEESAAIRKAAALAALAVLQRHVAAHPMPSLDGPPQPGRGYAVVQVNVRVVEAVVARLLVAAAADPAAGVRRAILDSLRHGTALDPFLAQADCLRSLFVVLNDESGTVRSHAIEVVGRLAQRNPAYVLPALRGHLMQLLTDMEVSPDSRMREESAHLLGCLIQACPRLVLPYVAPILKALVSKLRTAAATAGAPPPLPKVGAKGAGGESGVAASVLATLAALARVAGAALRPHVGDVLPLVIDAIQDAAGTGKRAVAVATLGQVVESTGSVVAPYMEYPQLLGLLLRMLHEGSPQVRREVIKVLGIIGALDPHTHKVNQAALQGEGKLEREGVRPQRPATAAPAGTVAALGGVAGEEAGGDLLPAAGLVTSAEEYYPTVAINALMRTLRDPSTSSHHLHVLRCLFYILQQLGLAAVPYLPKVMPMLFSVIRTGDDALREFLLAQLTALVGALRQHMRRYLPAILAMVHQHWAPGGPLLAPLLRLIAQLSGALRDDFRGYLPELLPRFIGLFAEAERSGSYDMVKPALAALEALGSAVEEQLPPLLPALVRLVCPVTGMAGTPMEIRVAALQTMRRLLPRMQLAGYASAILHPMVRVLDGPHDELRAEALETIAALTVALGPDAAIFAPTIRKVMAKHRLSNDRFGSIASRAQALTPANSIMSEADDGELVSSSWGDDPAPQTDNTGALQPLPDANGGGARLAVNEAVLRRAWESSARSTREDWDEWMRHFSVELLKESPAPALRATASLAQVNPAMARELFAAGFVSCWAGLGEAAREALVRSLEAALAAPSIPAELVTQLLNLAEFMEHDEKPLPLDTRTLGALAEKCHAFAKALHYKELEYASSPTTAVEALISINNHLRQPEAAVGILIVAQQVLHLELKESWYEKLQRWDEALEAYERKCALSLPGSPAYLEAALGRLRCLASLAEWERLSEECRNEWALVEPHVQREMAPLAAHAAWQLGNWEEMTDYVHVINGAGQPETSTGAFLTAVLSVRRGDYSTAHVAVERARGALGTELAALVGESYERAYGDMVRVQQLTELEETIAYSVAGHPPPGGEAAAEAKRALIRDTWRARLRGVQRNVEVWQALLSVRSLVLPMGQDQHTWLKFASLCRKSGRVRQSRRTLVALLGYNPITLREPSQPGFAAGSGRPHVMFGFLKHLWHVGERAEAFSRLAQLAAEVSALPPEQAPGATLHGGNAAAAAALAPLALPATGVAGTAVVAGAATGGVAAGGPSSGLAGLAAAAAGEYRAPLAARVRLRLGMWRWSTAEELSDNTVSEVLAAMAAATAGAPNWGKAWHNWALFNVAAMDHCARTKGDPARAQAFVAPAVHGFFRSVALGQASGEANAGANLQDILRLLTLWFTHGSAPDVEAALLHGFGHVSIDTWLVVIPQVIARIHTNIVPVRNLIHSLLVRIGRHHPQALMYPLLVACKSQSPARRAAAMQVVDNVRQHSATLVEQASLVSQELIRMAILWHEMWHEALEEASRLYFGESNVEGMLATLAPLHEMMQQNGPSTLKEIAFVQAYGRELQEAHEWCQRYRASRREAELHQAWDLYYHVFKRINKQLPSLTVLELQYVAPALVRAQGLELAVPGTYIAGEPVVTIAAFAPQLAVITSKQRPRKLTIHGSDGAEYVFLLKGHEDLRQDERVMQLFGLVNTMLANDRATAERDLSIARYAVIPLSPNSGLIGWVPNTDTLHALIREYREARRVPLNAEHRLMLGMAPDYDQLPVIHKVEVFQHALDSTSGEDLHKVLWLKSRNSEVWLDRRTNYTRSAAVMSMVGYLLGLGDRHPSNLMLDRYSGKLLHIDFGDCFEASMNREKFPEKVPFRLTRMMIKAMEVSGIEGNFRSMCEAVMRVLRGNKDSVMAMLEAFVHDPLINWRLLNTTDAEDAPLARRSEHPAAHHGAGNELLLDAVSAARAEVSGGGHHDTAAARAGGAMPSPPRRDARERELLSAYGQLGDANEVLNERAVAVMKRMSDKLTGRDWAAEGAPGAADSDSVPSQVHRLILQATSHENLCQSYIGWCPFW